MWIEELPNGKYKYFERYKDKRGRTKRVSVTLDKKTAQAQKQATAILLQKIQEKSYQLESTNVLFWDIIDQLQEFEKKTVKPATYRHHKAKRTLVKKYIPSDTLLSAVSKKWITEILEDIYYNRNYSKSSIISYKAYFSNVFEFAIKKGYPVTNQSKGIKITEKTKTIEEKLAEIPKYLELDELKEVIVLAGEKNKRWSLFIEFLSLTGLRQGEAFGLQKHNLIGDKLQIIGTYDRYVKEKVLPKNEPSIRTIKLNSRAIEILQYIIDENNKKGYKTDFIWISRRKGTVLVDSVFNHFLKDLNYSKKNLTSHIFRHTHISLLTELGVPLKAIMERVGHINPKTTLAIYSHVTDKISANLIEKLDSLPL